MNTSPQRPASPEPVPRVLVVDDEALVLKSFVRIFQRAGYEVEAVGSAAAAQALLVLRPFDLILSDIDLPGLNGIEFLRSVRDMDLDIPFLVVTGNPHVETAIKAMEYGALRYLTKPIERQSLLEAAAQATRLHRLARVRREAAQYLSAGGKQMVDRAGLERDLDSALRTLWMAYQPIVCWSKKAVYAYEALVRSEEPRLPHPGALFDAAERLERLPIVGGTIRAQVALVAPLSPADHVFVNLHPHDLLDEALYEPDAPLSKVAPRIVLEITERAALDQISNVGARVARLRKLGFRIAVDDLGAGYAGLSSFAQLAPEVVKLDLSLIRGIDRESTKQKLVRSMTSLCADMGTTLVAEGVETAAERDTLVELGCDFFQGYLFARPGPAWAAVKW